jgi:formylmethanofuran dehydrogenase subunit E
MIIETKGDSDTSIFTLFVSNIHQGQRKLKFYDRGKDYEIVVKNGTGRARRTVCFEIINEKIDTGNLDFNTIGYNDLT